MIQLAQVQPKAPELTFWEKAIKRYRKEHDDDESLDCEIRAKLLDANREQVAKERPKRESWVAPEHQRDAQFIAFKARQKMKAIKDEQRMARSAENARRWLDRMAER